VDATLGLPILVGLIAVALLFDFLNGLHDAANSIATIVSTRVLRPHYAVLWAGFFNFIAFTVFGLNVAHTIGTGIVEPSVIDNQVIFAALVETGPRALDAGFVPVAEVPAARALVAPSARNVNAPASEAARRMRCRDDPSKTLMLVLGHAQANRSCIAASASSSTCSGAWPASITRTLAGSSRARSS